ncbi:NAD(P)-dependent oxidoreductase [Prosthecobacter dejongeii]|uniref:3-hydroxyisobutyrate dehydrogenase-like beta-hydroxyacid dehydrogenase n=1 Tax=Prosthecobacter dejongeii TaxID=48465 RepID=A0A7W7YQ90_9BACT|nr:NAD(P)-dependent oxidoreductase [Prosthecobacter dejongeii]MBB5040125.1 3-hydroxyisobutyrate dehydrogenase-like beta-hydroxyacid dehydrogenase [Prosthecobacter dejongeii]
MNQPSPVGVLGLGIIGSRVAENLRRAGHPVHVWSHTARNVPGALPSPRDVANAAMVIQIFVRDGEALLTALRDMQPALTPDHVILNHATVSKTATLEAAALCAESGATFLDAPFTGSKMAAQNGKLVYYIGGATEVLEKARPILEASSAKILPLGETGDATVLKIVTNLVTAITVKALAEAAAITHSQGIPLENLLTALENNANYSGLIGMKLPTIIQGDFEAHFSLRNMLKDANFARELASQGGVSTPALDCTAETMRSGVNQGKGDLDFSVIGQIAS